MVSTRSAPDQANKDIFKGCDEVGVRMSQKRDKVLLERKRSRARNVADAEAVKEKGLARDAFGKMTTSQCILTSVDASGKDTVTLVSWWTRRRSGRRGECTALRGARRSSKQR